MNWLINLLLIIDLFIKYKMWLTINNLKFLGTYFILPNN